MLRDIELSREDLYEVYSWIDGLSLSRSKRNINRDFSDAGLCGFLVVILSYDAGDYVSASATPMKIDNWRLLNERVLRRIRVILSGDDCNQLASGEPLYIEKLLLIVKRWTELKNLTPAPPASQKSPIRNNTPMRSTSRPKERSDPISSSRPHTPPKRPAPVNSSSTVGGSMSGSRNRTPPPSNVAFGSRTPSRLSLHQAPSESSFSHTSNLRLNETLTQPSTKQASSTSRTPQRFAFGRSVAPAPPASLSRTSSRSQVDKPPPITPGRRTLPLNMASPQRDVSGSLHADTTFTSQPIGEDSKTPSVGVEASSRTLLEAERKLHQAQLAAKSSEIKHLREQLASVSIPGKDVPVVIPAEHMNEEVASLRGELLALKTDLLNERKISATLTAERDTLLREVTQSKAEALQFNAALISANSHIVELESSLSQANETADASRNALLLSVEESQRLSDEVQSIQVILDEANSVVETLRAERMQLAVKVETLEAELRQRPSGQAVASSSSATGGRGVSVMMELKQSLTQKEAELSQAEANGEDVEAIRSELQRIRENIKQVSMQSLQLRSELSVQRTLSRDLSCSELPARHSAPINDKTAELPQATLLSAAADTTAPISAPAEFTPAELQAEVKECTDIAQSEMESHHLAEELEPHAGEFLGDFYADHHSRSNFPNEFSEVPYIGDHFSMDGDDSGESTF